MKFEYTGNGEEALLHPKFIELKEKGQIVETQDPVLIKALENHQDFKKLGVSKKGGKI